MAKLKTGRHTSGLKAARQAESRHWVNSARMDEAKGLTKKLAEALGKKDASKAKELLPEVVSIWQRLGRKNLIHHATASRKIGRLSRSVHRLISSTASKS